MMHKDYDDEEKPQDDDDTVIDGFLSACSAINIIDALTIPKIATDEEWAATKEKLNQAFTDEHYDIIV